MTLLPPLLSLTLVFFAAVSADAIAAEFAAAVVECKSTLPTLHQQLLHFVLLLLFVLNLKFVVFEFDFIVI